MKKLSKTQLTHLENHLAGLNQLWNSTFLLMFSLYISGWTLTQKWPFISNVLHTDDLERPAIALVLFWLVALLYLFALYPLSIAFVNTCDQTYHWTQKVPALFATTLQYKYPIYREFKVGTIVVSLVIPLLFQLHSFNLVAGLNAKTFHDLFFPQERSLSTRYVIDLKSNPPSHKIILTSLQESNPIRAISEDRYRLGKKAHNGGLTFWPFWEVWLMLLVIVSSIGCFVHYGLCLLRQQVRINQSAIN